MTAKSCLLCPIGSICRLILLNFRDEGTKICIADNALTLIAPAYGQALTRLWYNDSRQDICALYYMIVRFIEMYLCAPNVKKQKKNNNVVDDVESIPSTQFVLSDKSQACLKQLGQYLCEGLTILQKTYNYDNVVLSLQYYILLIKSGINGTYSPDLLPQHLHNEKIHFFDPAKVQDLWNDESIEQVCTLYNNLFSAKKANNKVMVQAYDNALITILDENDKKFKIIVDS